MVNLDAQVEHIFLSSDLEENSEQERVTNLEFEQTGRLNRYETQLSVFNDHHITVRSKGLGKKSRDYELNLGLLDSSPKRVRIINHVYSLFAILSFAALVYTLWMVKGPNFWIVAPTLLSSLAASTGLAIFYSRDRIVFFSKHGRAPLIVLLNRNPSSENLQAFVSDLSARIEKAQKQWSNKQDFLSAELRAHRDLQAQGALSDKGYQISKKRILDRHH